MLKWDVETDSYEVETVESENNIADILTWMGDLVRLLRKLPIWENNRAYVLFSTKPLTRNQKPI